MTRALYNAHFGNGSNIYLSYFEIARVNVILRVLKRHYAGSSDKLHFSKVTKLVRAESIQRNGKQVYPFKHGHNLSVSKTLLMLASVNDVRCGERALIAGPPIRITQNPPREFRKGSAQHLRNPRFVELTERVG